MNAQDVVQALMRRWYIALVGLIAAAGVAGMLYVATPASYQSSAVVTVVPPTFIPLPQSPGTVGTNPLLRLDETTGRTAYVVVANVDTASMHAVIADRTRGGAYTISNMELQLQAAMPAIKITGTASDPGAAKATADDVVAEVNDGLIKLQNRVSVPGDVRLRLDVTAEPSYGTAVGSSRARSAAAGAAAVVLLSIFLLVVIDTVVNRRIFPGSHQEQQTGNAQAVGRRHQQWDPVGASPTPELPLGRDFKPEQDNGMSGIETPQR